MLLRQPIKGPEINVSSQSTANKELCCYLSSSWTKRMAATGTCQWEAVKTHHLDKGITILTGDKCGTGILCFSSNFQRVIIIFQTGGCKKKKGGGGPQIMSTEAVILCKYSPDMQLISLAWSTQLDTYHTYKQQWNIQILILYYFYLGFSDFSLIPEYTYSLDLEKI